MKIALIGNQNNNLFCLCRHLRDLGYDADLLMLGNEPEHFHPGADSLDDSYTEFCKSVIWGDFAYYSTIIGLSSYHRLFHNDPMRAATVARDVAQYDVVIACGAAPAFLDQIGRRIDVFVPYGSDFSDLPFPRFKRFTREPLLSARAIKYQIDYLRFCRHQRQGIRTARHILIGQHNFPPLARRLDCAGQLHHFIAPLVYLPAYSAERLAGSAEARTILERVADLRSRHDLLVMSHARHVWASPAPDYDRKSNDVLIRGFAAFVSSGAARSPLLMLAEYGPDVEASRQLIAELGIGANVLWLTRMQRKDLMVYLSQVDASAGDFFNGWFLNGVVSEGLAMARPVLHNCRLGEAEGVYPPYPHLQASTIDEVRQRLIELAEDPDTHTALGRAGQAWIKHHVFESSVSRFREIIDRRMDEIEASGCL